MNCSNLQVAPAFIQASQNLSAPSKILCLGVPGWRQPLAPWLGLTLARSRSQPLLAGKGQRGAHLNGLEAPCACSALLGRQLDSACSGLWQWLQKTVMVPALGCLELAARFLLPLPPAASEPADPAAPGLLL